MEGCDGAMLLIHSRKENKNHNYPIPSLHLWSLVKFLYHVQWANACQWDSYLVTNTANGESFMFLGITLQILREIRRGEKRLLSSRFLSISLRGRRYFFCFSLGANSLTAETTSLFPGNPAVFPSPKSETPIRTGKCLDRDNFIRT